MSFTKIKICNYTVITALIFIAASARAQYQTNLIHNGDFEAAPVLSSGQTIVPIGFSKLIAKNPNDPYYSNSISGIPNWVYATPGYNGTASDHGLDRRNAVFGLPAQGQSAFINNWNRMMSQTVSNSFNSGDTVNAYIDFGTMGADTDAGRAGRFYLVAGEASPANPDQFSSRSIVLRELSIANPTWTRFVPNRVVGNTQYLEINLSYTFRSNDPALNLPLTLAFRTVDSSVGPTFWDNAFLSVEPATPVVSGLSPTSVLRGSPAFTLTVNGAYFINGAKARWDGTDRTTTFISSTQLNMDITTSDVATAKTAQVTVINPTVGSSESVPLTFSVNNPIPILAHLTPSSATAGTTSMTFTVEGTGFVPETVAQWGGSPRTTFYVSPTALRMQINRNDLALGGIFNVSASNPAPGGGPSGSLPFTVNGVPLISVSSATVTRSGAVQVTIRLTNFGTSPAVDLRLTASRLNGVGAVTTLPINLPILDAGVTSDPIVLTFPASVPAGSRALTLTMTGLGRSLTASRLVIVP